MSRLPSRVAGPWDKLIRVQDLLISIQQRYVAAKDAIELVLDESKKSIPESVETLRVHKKIMRNYLESWTFRSAQHSPQRDHTKTRSWEIGSNL